MIIGEFSDSLLLTSVVPNRSRKQCENLREKQRIEVCPSDFTDNYLGDAFCRLIYVRHATMVLGSTELRMELTSVISGVRLLRTLLRARNR